MKTVGGFRKVPSVAFDTTNNGSSNPWKSTRFTRLVAECFNGLSKTFYTVFSWNLATSNFAHYYVCTLKILLKSCFCSWYIAACH